MKYINPISTSISSGSNIIINFIIGIAIGAVLTVIMLAWGVVCSRKKSNQADTQAA